MPTACLIIFTRYPTIGQVKTRLIPALGAAGAALLHQQMTKLVIAQVQILQQLMAVQVEIYFAGDPNVSAMAGWLGHSWSYRPQVAGDLGERMSRAAATCLQAGYQRVVIVGTDCPSLTAALLQAAFTHLTTHDLVLGPAIDGGYYLIGMRAMQPKLFVGVAWSTERVLAQTIAIAHQLNLAVRMLPFLADIDRPEDLAIWKQLKNDKKSVPELISVIIPARNEEQAIALAIASAMAPWVEIIVVDGDSSDKTKQVAAATGVKVLSTMPGRAQQMNRGAQVATGQILLFLHADTVLPKGFAPAVRAAMPAPNSPTKRAAKNIAGAFTLKIAEQSLGLRVVEWGVKWRSRFLQMPYGDQAIFLRHETFQKVGGFLELPLMEDFELISRLKRSGKVATLPEAVITSGRRWLSKGIFRTTLINQMIVVAYWWGVPPEQLAQWYRQPPKHLTAPEPPDQDSDHSE